MHQRISSIAATALLTAGLVLPALTPADATTESSGSTAIDAVEAQASAKGFKKGYTYECKIANGTWNWKGKDPKKCSGWYQVVNENSGKAALIVSPDKNGQPWKAIKKGYKATNKWCADNTATCQIISGTAVAIVQGIFTSNNW
jgi:hypothetical protein